MLLYDINLAIDKVRYCMEQLGVNSNKGYIYAGFRVTTHV